MSIRVKHVGLYVLNTHLRIPFRYGIATATAIPHLFVRADLEINRTRCVGIASDGLAPKWFTKNPQQSYRDELADMLHVIETACGYAEQIGDAESVFDLWQQIYVQQMSWAAQEGYPPLLWSFGVSLIERAIIEGFCRQTKTRFADAVRKNTLGLRLGEMHKELMAFEPAQLLPAEPARSVAIRHTVGLSDPLTDAEITPEDRVNDGLPQSLEAAIATYGLRYFKIKLGGEVDRDIARLKQIHAILQRHCGEDYRYTLDGNEFYKEVEPLEQMWRQLKADATLGSFLSKLLFVEQPLHRDVALSVDVSDALTDWDDRPPMIIDESDALLGSTEEALESGYAGTSHKNCKGVFKGLANACMLEHRRRTDPTRPYVMSGEDLCSIGPVAMLMDLAAGATLGLEHVERNGHHYFKGLSMYPEVVQQQALAAHADVYRQHLVTDCGAGFPTLNIRDGRLEIGSVVDAPFGVMNLDVARFTPLDQWTFESLGMSTP